MLWENFQMTKQNSTLHTKLHRQNWPGTPPPKSGQNTPKNCMILTWNGTFFRWPRRMAPWYYHITFGVTSRSHYSLLVPIIVKVRLLSWLGPMWCDPISELRSCLTSDDSPCRNPSDRSCQNSGRVETWVRSVYRIYDRILYITMLKCLFKYNIEDGEISLLH